MPLAPAVLARLTPYLERLIAQRPDIWGRFVVAAQKAGYAIGNTAKEAVAYIKANPINATAILAMLASAGASVADLFGPGDKVDPAVRSLTVSLEDLYLASQGVDTEGVKRIRDSADKSQELEGLIPNFRDLNTARAILRWARSHYGSPSAAIRAHGLQQAFFEMSREDVENGFEILDI